MRYLKYITIIVVSIIILAFLISSHLTSNPSIGSSYLISDTTTIATSDDTWYNINGRYENGYNYKFTLSASGLIYDGESNLFLFVGSSNSKVDKVCTITYGLFKNNEASPIDVGFETPVAFTSANSYGNFAIVRYLWIDKNDTLSVKFKSTANTTTMTTDQLSVIFYQLKSF